jgi:2-phospho-L-lactate guanylyltransferase
LSTLAIVPVKRLGLAKQRLAGRLEPAARRLLATAMLADVLAALGETAGIDGILVVSRDREAAGLARRHGAKTLDRAGDRSLGTALEIGLAAANASGAQRALVLAADCPLLDPSELAVALVEARRATVAVTAFADRHGAGTNALLLAPPGAIVPAFGPGSLARHLGAAASAEVTAREARLPSLALDVDTPADLDRLCGLLARHPQRAPRTGAALRAACGQPAPVS